MMTLMRAALGLAAPFVALLTATNNTHTATAAIAAISGATASSIALSDLRA